MVLKVPLNTGINRIRLEFKGFQVSTYRQIHSVLIESDWNLKIVEIGYNVKGDIVLIESDWNLKLRAFEFGKHRNQVLIESDWNLKYAQSQK